jgi:hypothetical protein
MYSIDIQPEARVILVLYAYMMLLLGLMFLVNHVPEVAEAADNYVRSKTYNLREIPRVNYKEESESESEEEMEDCDCDSAAAAVHSEDEKLTLRRRRQTNPLGRILDEAFD